MRNKKMLKSITAIVMSLILLATSIPFALAGGGAYDPAPYFDDAAKEQGAAAWLNTDGTVLVYFPAATGAYASYKMTGDKKEIAAYVLELCDLGTPTTGYVEDPDPLTITVDANGAGIQGYAANGGVLAKFTKEEIAAKFGKLDLLNRRYSVTITAADEAGWFSQSLYAQVSDVPSYTFDPDALAPLTDNPNAMREMMAFEESKSDIQSSNGVSSAQDYRQSGDSIVVKGAVDQAGDEFPGTTTDSKGYRIQITGAPGEGGQSMDTSWSRETWSYGGAEDVWFWLDLSQVEMTGISFRLRSNEKQWKDRGGRNPEAPYFSRGDENTLPDKYGTVYSTVGTTKAGYTGAAPYVYVQQEDGSWKKVMMQNGTIDLAHFEGYVRVPLEFFCSETDTSVQVGNQNLNQHDNFATNGNRFTGYSVNDANARAFMNAQYLRNPDGSIADVLVDQAGTPISEALLIQRRGQYHQRQTGAFDGGANDWVMTYMKTGPDNATTDSDANMLAACINNTDVNNGKAAYVDSTTLTIQNEENAYKAIDDVMSAGIAYTGIGEGSVNKSIYLDNVLFYRTTGKFDDNSIKAGETKIGFPVSTYYDQHSVIQRSVFSAIEKYIETPDYTDYRAVRYIDAMLNAYREAYKDASGGNSFLNDDAMAAKAEAIGKAKVWQNFVDAKTACQAEGTYGKTNSDENDLVPMLVQSMEKLPEPETVTTVSDRLRTEITKLYQAYSHLNLGQLRMLSQAEEDRLVAYFELIKNHLEGGFLTGKQLANMPYIMFNDFEQNTDAYYGNRVPQMEDDAKYPGQSDYRHTEGLFTYSSRNADTVIKVDNGVDYSGLQMDSVANSAWAEVTSDGFKGSRGVTATVDSSFVADSSSPGTDTNAVWHTVNFSRNSKSAADFSAYTANNMADVNLAGLSKACDGIDEKTQIPLSLVFYVDFTKMKDFAFTVNVYTKLADGSLRKARPDFGSKAEDQKYFLLDPADGQWKLVHTGNQYSFRSGGVEGDTVTLDNYKGYLMVPLYHLKYKGSGAAGLFATNKLDESGEVLNNIYEIQFAITGTSAAGIDEKQYVIDNVGFAYDPVFYASVAGGRTDKTYAELFGAKSDAAQTFEDYVSAIDPYDEATFASAVATAKTMYDALGSYQKQSVQSVIQAKATLDFYQGILDGTQILPHATMTPDELKAAIDALPDGAKNANSTANDLPYPGFNEDGSVNYGAYGFTGAEQAKTVVELYEKQYKYYSAAQKALLGADYQTALLNAYAAARRCLPNAEMGKVPLTSMGDMSASALTLLENLGKCYTTLEGSTDRFTTFTHRDEIAAIWQTYYNDGLPYFAKQELAAGTMGTTLAGAQYVNRGIPLFLNNLREAEVKVSDTLTTKGGIDVLLKKYQDIFTRTEEKLNNKVLFTEEELTELQETINEYEALRPAYHNVAGLYLTIEKIKDLFPAADVAFEDGSTAATVIMTDDAREKDVKLNINYLEEFPVPADGNSETYFKVSYDGVLENAAVAGKTANYDLLWNGQTVAKTTDGSSVDVTTDAKNNQYTAAAPNAITLTAKLTSSVLLDRVEDTVTITHYRKAKDGETEDRVLGTYTLSVVYTHEDDYTVYIPAEFPVDWGTQETDVSYSCSYALNPNSSINVGVTGASVTGSGGTLTAVQDASKTMAYSARNFKGTTFSGEGTAQKPADAPKVVIAENTWNASPVGEYRDTLTYTVTYTPAPPTT